MKQLSVKDIREGDTIIESCYGKSIEMVAMEDAHEVNEELRNGWVCKCWLDKDSLELFEAYDCGPYGLNLRKV